MFEGLECDSDTESDIESCDETKITKQKQLTFNNLELDDSESDNSESDNSDSEYENNEEKKTITTSVKKNKMKKQEKQNMKKEQKNMKNNNKIQKSMENCKTLFAEEIFVDVSNKVIIENSKVVINENVKYFVLGENGCGKTTLLNYLYDRLKQNIDNILILNQHIDIKDTDQTCLEYILESELQTKYLELVEIEKNEITDVEYYENLSNYVYVENNYEKYNAEAQKILIGLGLNKNDKVILLSGGWRMRISLGKFLLVKPEILFLDEPTNHLDLNAVIWLNNYLLTYTKTLIIASHNIGFIDNISNVIWYMNDKTLTTIHGKYYKYKKIIEDQEKEKEKIYLSYKNRLTALRNRKKPKPATKNDIDSFIKKEFVEIPYKKNVVVKFDNVANTINKNIIEFRDVSFNYNTKNIFKNINFKIGMDSRIILVGNNGVGKTTLFKLCAGFEKETDGFIYKDERVKVSYYHQHIIDNLPLDKSPIEYLKDTYNVDMTVCRNYLGKIGLRDKNVCNLKIGKLSGGQKARVALCSIQLDKPNIILMDEPTNHLDIDTIEELITGINNFNGGFVIITHDTYLIENIDNAKIYYVDNNDIKYFNREFEQYCKLVCNEE